MRRVLSMLWWPLLVVGPVLFVAQGTTPAEQQRLFFPAYAMLVVAIAILERLMPHEKAWTKPDGQTLNDLLHTATLKGLGFVLSFFVVKTGASMAGAEASGLWPGDWPLILQVALGLVVVEFGFYWAHRLAHQWMPLWHFHAVHHSVTRLWFVNTGRFHFGDSLVSLAFSQPLQYLAGAPQPVFLWVGFMTMFWGLLTHCNIEMRTGPISYLINTPNLHRWHHSPKIAEGNNNYGENIMLWDLLFGTWYLPKDRRPPEAIGIHETMPPRFLQQIAYPFRRLREGSARTRA